MTAIALHPAGAVPPAVPEPASDAALARRVAAGDDAAYAATYARYHERIEAYCRAIVRHDEDARDAAQTTMTKALVAMRAHGETAHLRPWLYRIAHNEAVTVLRRRRPHHELTEALEGLDSDPALQVLLREQLRATLDALAALPESHRRALLLRELGGLDYATVAEATSMTPRARRQAVFRARGPCAPSARPASTHSARRSAASSPGATGAAGAPAGSAPTCAPATPVASGTPRARARCGSSRQRRARSGAG